MTPQAFITHWADNDITERAGAQQHFNDLCDLLGVEKPRDTENYCFERGAKTQGGQGWADVWKRGCFAWEYKAPGRDLGAALKQLMNYALALDNPPLLIVSDLRNIEIHTHFTGHPSEVHRIALQDFTQPEARQKLLWLFTEPERFKPTRTTFAVTEAAATRMGEIATRLTGRGNNPHMVAHFLIQCVFCMFAEDAKILPEKLFETVMDRSTHDGSKAQKRLADLFAAMQKGGEFALNDIPWFNGGLFEQVEVPALLTDDVVALLDAARMDWSAIEPAILGTLFERGLNPDMRSQLGAHYTDPATIMKLIRPAIEQPLLAEWEAAKATITTAKRDKDKQAAFIGFLERLRAYRVLDPACGSGNFLYLALKTLKDLEHRVNLEAETLGLHRELGIGVSPANVVGIELNPYAAELARVTVWIGEIQWMLAHGYAYRRDPILQKLDHIECRDAVLNYATPTPTTFWCSEPEWPTVDAIVGNPPFLGDKKMIGELGADYTDTLRTCYEGRVPGAADLVTYWFEKARAHIEQGKAKIAGLVGTNSIRGGASRKVLERIVESGSIFEAWSDEEWINEGAAVRVSLVCFCSAGGLACMHADRRAITRVAGEAACATLDGQPVAAIHADLTAGGGLDLTQAKPLKENAGVAFIGIQKTGPFDLPGELARAWLKQPNPNGRSNCEIVKPWFNGLDITRRNRDMWIVDFGTDMQETEACLYELPFAYAKTHVQPTRVGKREARTNEMWWLFQWSRPVMRKALDGLPRFIVTPEVAKHRVFAWMASPTVPDKNLTVIARSDDTTFGILHSRFHELWSLRMGTSLEDRPRYTPTTTFETFPFPAGDEGAAQAIAAAAQRLDQLRNQWLNPPEWTDWVRTPEEEKAGYPARPVAKSSHEADLKKRTLTNLYNARPAWLDNIHKELDAAVAVAYGWADHTPEMPDEEILRRLLRLNIERTH